MHPLDVSLGKMNYQYSSNTEILGIYDYEKTGQSWAVIGGYRQRKKEEETYALT